MPLRRMKTKTMDSLPACPRILMFIKPWDDEVFENFFMILKALQVQEEIHVDCRITIVLPPDLN